MPPKQKKSKQKPRDPAEDAPKPPTKDLTEADSEDLEVTLEKVSEIVGQRVEPAQLQALVGVIQAEYYHFSGPLPHPDHWERYVATLGDGGKGLLKIAQDEQTHRHEMDSRHLAIDELVIRRDLLRADRGQWMFYSIIVMFVAGGLMGLYLEKPIAGYSGLAGALATTIGSMFAPKLTKWREGRKEARAQKKG